MRIAGAWLGLVLGSVLLVVPTAAPAVAANGLVMTSTISGASLAAAGSNAPLRLEPRDDKVVHISVTNNGASAVSIRYVRLRAKVLGLAFFSYTTRVDLTVDPGATGTRTFALDLSDLDGQADGLMPGELALLAPDRSELISESGTVDVRGKVLSVYGVFGLAVALVTALLILGLLFHLVRRSLPESRWARSLRCAAPGVGVGLAATFTLGVLRIAVPTLGLSLGLLVGGLVVGAILGWLTPAPGDEADRDELDERDVVTVAATRPTAPLLHPTPAVPLTTMTPVQPRVPPTGPPPAPPSAPLAQPAPPMVEDDPRQTRIVQAPPPPPPA